MKKLIYLLVFVASITLTACGASEKSTASAEHYKIKNIKFETQNVVITQDNLGTDDVH